MKDLQHLAKYLYLCLLITLTSGCVVDSNYESNQVLTVGGDKEFRITFDDDTVMSSVNSWNDIMLHGPSGVIDYSWIRHEGQTLEINYRNLLEDGEYMLVIYYDHTKRGKLIYVLPFKMNNLNNEELLYKASVAVYSKGLGILTWFNGEVPNSMFIKDRVYLRTPDGNKMYPYSSDDSSFLFDWNENLCDGNKAAALYLDAEPNEYPDLQGHVINGVKPIKLLKFVPCSKDY